MLHTTPHFSALVSTHPFAFRPLLAHLVCAAPHHPATNMRTTVCRIDKYIRPVNVEHLLVGSIESHHCGMPICVCQGFHDVREGIDTLLPRVWRGALPQCCRVHSPRGEFVSVGLRRWTPKDVRPMSTKW